MTYELSEPNQRGDVAVTVRNDDGTIYVISVMPLDSAKVVAELSGWVAK